ncbi:NifU family protein [Lujinxingia vulgaris]|uniref:NifU family protein n=1 Tax=Lujinxingia vulgaris TaxID=2600176 RepID=A0A5C6X503_9DELT|nr:NifU family protein [Lujinxingia vulgaris]TXD31594.1 NifU family protein [Lujinxingia vulgaris]
MKIAEIEPTPNPNAMKFVLTEAITHGFVTRSFEDFNQASTVPLAKAIFEIDHVISVYFADRWITVTQDGGAEWSQLLRAVAEPIRAASFADANPEGGLSVSGDDTDDSDLPGMDDPRIPLIRETIDEHIMPFLAGDGGGLKIMGLVDNQLLVRYEGACGTCPASMTGTLLAIENLLQVEVDPELYVATV